VAAEAAARSGCSGHLVSHPVRAATAIRQLEHGAAQQFGDGAESMVLVRESTLR
jgi:hypothetical protein